MKAQIKTRKILFFLEYLFSLRLVKRLASIMFFFLLFSLFGACSDDEIGEREQFLIVSETIEKLPIVEVYCEIAGGLDTLYVFSNVEYKVFFQTSDADTQWVKILSSDYIQNIGAHQIIVEIAPMGKSFLKRTGTLTFSSKENYMGKYILFSQGFHARLNERFDWLKYGTPSPLDSSKEVLMANWSAEQKEHGWISTISENEEQAFCYGKNVSVKLGNDMIGADLITPVIPLIANDLVLLLSFNAVAFISENGEEDGSQMTINIVGGGEFVSGGTTVSINLGYYDYTNKKLHSSMWDSSTYSFYIKSPETNPITADTKLQFMTGANILSAPKNRLFIDNIILYSIDKNSYYLAGDGLFTKVN